MDTPSTGPFDLTSQRLGALPVVSHFLARAGLPALLERYLPAGDARVRLAPAAAVRLVVTNLLTGREPLYALGEWAGRFVPGPAGPGSRRGRGAQRRPGGPGAGQLFDADRASLLTALMLGVILDQRVRGLPGRDRHTTRRQTHPADHLFGHSKDHRPDLKQLVWILTVAADGAVPIAYRLADGNTNDDPTHVPTWDCLVALLGRTDFLYVADCKLASTAAMSHIAARGGRFVTVLPRTRSEDRWFRDWVQTHQPQWTEALRLPGARLGEPDRVWSVFPAPLPSAEGHRVIWVHSSDKAARDAAARQARIKAGTATIDALAAHLAGPKCRLKTRVAVTEAAAAALDSARASRWISTTITETVEETYRQEHRGRPGANTRYHRRTRTRFSISSDIVLDRVAYDATSDGCFPLVSNDTALTDAEVLAAYRYQPHLERRHHLLKSMQHAAPVLLHNPARIEAIFCCQFLASLISALTERQIRTAMATAHAANIPLYPELRGCAAPSAPRILEIFTDVTRHELRRGGQLIQTFEPDLNPLQLQVLQLLGIPTTSYTPA